MSATLANDQDHLDVGFCFPLLPVLRAHVRRMPPFLIVVLAGGGQPSCIHSSH